MPDAVAFIQWVHYAGSASSTALFDQPQLSFSSKQHRLHELDRGDILWLVSRCPEDRQYYFVAALSVSACGVNESSSDRGRLFGVHRVDCDRLSSQALGRRFPAEGLLRALLFDSRKPIQYGASIGQALQTLRFLDGQDQALLRTTLARLHSSSSRTLDHPHGLWTKCDAQYARYFAANWTDRKEPLAFLLYDPPPALEPGAPVFIHSDRHLRLIARFAGAEPIEDLQRTLRKADGPRAIADAVTVVEQHRFDAALAEIDRERDADRPSAGNHDRVADGCCGSLIGRCAILELPMRLRTAIRSAALQATAET